MRIFFISVIMLFTAVSVRADTPPVIELLESAQENIKKWQIEDASEDAYEALRFAQSAEVSREVWRVLAIVEYNKPNYPKAKEYAEKSLETQKNSFRRDTFMDYIIHVSNVSESFQEQQTEHFKIRFMDKKDAVAAYYAQEVLEKAYFEIGLDLEYYPESRIVVEIYPDIESFTLASTLPKESVENTGVVGICKFNRIMILSPRLMPKGYKWSDTLAHEYVHYLVFKKSENRTPVWLHEGIAKASEQRWRQTEGPSLSALHETLLSRALRDQKLVPIEKMHPSFAMLDTAEEAQLAFAQAGSTINFMVERWGKKSLNTLLDTLRENPDYENAITTVTGMSFQEFYDGWKNDLLSKGLEEKIKEIRPGSLEIKVSEDPGSDKENANLHEIKNKTARNHTRLGDLFYSRGRTKAAVYEYEKAAKLDPYSPFIAVRLTKSLIKSNRLKDAETYIKPVLEIHPEQIDLLMNLGEIYLLNGNLSKAESSYKDAIFINPYDPMVHIALKSIYEKQGKNKLSQKEQEILTILSSEG